MTEDRLIDAEVQAVREEYADEEAEAAEAEGAQNVAALDVALSLRISTFLDRQLRERASAEEIPVSALIRRLLSQTMNNEGAPVLTVGRVEEIARRVVREST
jgi:hypothetical protein